MNFFKQKRFTIIMLILYIVIAFFVCRLIIEVSATFNILQKDISEFTLPMDANLIPMIMGPSTTNLLMAAGVSVKTAECVTSVLNIVQSIMMISIVALTICLLRKSKAQHNLFQSQNLKWICYAIGIYIGFPILVLLLDCGIIICLFSIDMVVHYISIKVIQVSINALYGLFLIVLLEVYRHGIELQKEQDEMI